MAASAFAQQYRVTGKVMDVNGIGLPGINVVIKGTAIGTATDAEGNFTLAPPKNAILVITGIGYKTIERPVGAESSINITLEEENVALDEVIVTGYSIDNRREVAGAVSTVKAQDLTVVPSGNVEQQLQGRVSGVTVITNGQPGTTSQIRVRGFGSFENNEPLYVVDGVPVNTTDFLNPDDIENVTVLKDAASASIYGARAASGVIVYTTKTGKRNAKKLSVSYDGLWGVTTPGEGQKMMNTTDYAAWTKKAYENSGIAGPHPQFGPVSNWKIPDYILVGSSGGVFGNIDLNAERAKYNVTDYSKTIYQVIAANREGTDWYREITRNAPLMRHAIGISGGGENSRYYVGFSLQDQQGILKNNSFKRYTFRANTEFNILKNLRMGENLQLSYRQALGLSGGNGGKGVATEENDILFAFRMPPIIPMYDVFGGYAGTRAPGFNNGQNPAARRDRLGNNRSFDGIGFGNIYLELEPAKGLTLRSSLGGNYRSNNSRSYFPRTYENSENINSYTYTEGSEYYLGWTFTNTAAYKKVFNGKHSADVLIGQEALDAGTGRNTSASGLDPFITDLDYVSINNVGKRQVFGYQFKGVRFHSLFGQLRYSFSDKYIASAVVRRDGSSRFGAAHRYGVFPAVSAAWRISGERFMQPIKWISDLKFRAGYGTMGNSNAVDPNNQHTLYSTSIRQSSYDITGSNTSAAEGYYRERVGNPNAKWETSTTKNAGLDVSFFNSKLEITIDLWQKDTKDLLVKLPLPSPEGFQAQQPSVNTAQMVNKGLDMQITAYGKMKSGAIDYELTVNGSFLRNEITSIKDNLTYLGTINPFFRGGVTPIRNQLGHSLSAFYGYQTTGLFKDANEVAKAPKQAGAAPGRFRFADISGPDGRPDGKIDESDRTYLGSPIPKFTGGVNLKLKYKNFEAAAYLYASLGSKIFNQSRWFTDFYPSFSGAGISQRVKDSWTPDNTSAAIPFFENTSNFSTNTQSASFYVESGNYLRMQNLSLAYYFPQFMRNAIKAERLKVFIASNNLFTITKYTGLDPGVGGNTDTVFGIDQGNYPVTRSFTVGISLGL
ncbi:MAG: SusC/RagA family protein [Candidatus Nephrothrix sp. EaCA]|nr:MAG: SusC/RagA family protein [Candidatus Nephrothrix sp. EaCA]